MSQVSTGGGGAGAFAPFGKCGSEVMSGKFREVDFITTAVHTTNEVFDGCWEWCVWFINSEEDVVAWWGHSAMAEVVR